MRHLKLIMLAVVLAVLAGCATPPPPPPPPVAHHPAYLHALSDLRAARWMIEHRPGDWQRTNDEIEAVAQIDAAIGDLRQAAYDDGKNLNEHPPVDEIPEHRGRLHAALDYMRKARGEISREEDNAYANGLRGRAIGHIDGAINATRRAIDA
jgi:hypothetical protein